MADEFFRTIMGRRFYEGTMPSIATSLKRIADALDEDEQRQAGVRLAKAEAYASRDAFPLTPKRRPSQENSPPRSADDPFYPPRSIRYSTTPRKPSATTKG